MGRLCVQMNTLLLIFIILVFVVLVSIFNLPWSFGFSLTPHYKASEEIKQIHISQETVSVDLHQKQCDLKVHLKKNISIDPHAVPVGQGYIIYTCRGFCGGLADRLQGIATAYSIAIQTGRLFRIEETSVCGMTRFLRPSPWYNWILDRHHLHRQNLSTCYLSAMRGRSIIENDFVQYINESVIYLTTNKRSKRLRQNFREIFYTLFVYDSSIVGEIQTFKATYVKENKTVCAHIRVGKSANFSDSNYNNLGNLSAVWQFLSSYDKAGYVIFIASDSKEVLSSARNRYRKRFIEIPGQIFNLAFDNDDMVCSGLRKNVLDFAFLSQCNILLLTLSNMGKRASELRYNTNDQYCFQYGKVYPCPYYNLKWIRSSDNKEPLKGI